MTAPTLPRTSALRGELIRARSDLVEARSRQREKDSTSNRAALAACITTMDGVLDRYLATNHRG
jgi:hypothetical protein